MAHHSRGGLLKFMANKTVVKVGDVLGKFTVLEEIMAVGLNRRFKCRCECGVEKKMYLFLLKKENQISCKIRESGPGRRLICLPESGILNTWAAMLNRCTKPSFIYYNNYGGRGIKVCEDWENPKKFYEWALENGYKKGLQLDRINNDGNYCPDNCRFVTRLENAKNRKYHVKYNGEIAAEACRRLGGGKGLIAGRINLGWSLEKAFTTPKKH